MKVENRPNTLKATVLLLLAVFQCTVAVNGTPPSLTEPTWAGDQFQFVLRGQTNVNYIIESSNDLRTWSPALTNSDSYATRLVTVSAAGEYRFWRARPARPLFVNAIAARGKIFFGITNSIIDSYDSADPNYSTDGQYDAAKVRAGADVASAGTNGAIGVANAKIAGTLHTGPGGLVTIGPDGRVGELAWLNDPANAGQIQPGHYRDDMNLAFPTVSARPFSVGLSPFSGVVGGTNYTYLLRGGNYKVSGSLRMAGTGASAQKMLVTSNSVLWVTDTFSIDGDAKIIIGSNARLTLYMEKQFYAQANAQINVGGRSDQFACIGLNSPSEFYMSGFATIVGTTYIPAAKVDISANAQFFGAVVCGEFVMGGNAQFHYDENLKRVGPFF